MKISRVFYTPLTFVLLMMLASCSRPRYNLPLHLLMGIGPRIVDVSTGPTGRTTRTILGLLPHHLDVDALSRISSTRLLVSTYPKHKIFLFNTKSRKFRFVRNGWNAVYFSGAKAIVFFDNPKGGFTAQELWIAPLAHPSDARRLDHGPFPIPMPVVPVANNAFVYSSWRKTGKQRLWMYNITFGTYIPLHISGVYPELWLPHERLLLCVNLAKLDRPYSLRTLQGVRVGRLPIGNWYTPALVLDKPQIVLLGRQGAAMSSPFRRDTLMTYGIESKHLRVVLKHTFVGLGTIVEAGGNH